jgi:hypothetical protein
MTLIDADVIAMTISTGTMIGMIMEHAGTTCIIADAGLAVDRNSGFSSDSHVFFNSFLIRI